MGCASCGMSFCNKCLKQKCKIPSKGSSEFSVCRICYNKLTSKNETENSFSPPDTYLKRLENLENPVAPPITVYKQNPKFQKMKVGLTPADQKLVDRLEKLKDDKNKSPPPSETELRKRLAQLKGENFVETSYKNLLPTVDSRTNQEKVDGLLEQYTSERDIELQHNPQEEIEARLATLREQGVRPNEGPYMSNLHDSDDSEEEIGKISKKVMDEVALEEKTKVIIGSSGTEEEEQYENLDETDVLPWCVLCNNDANVKCIECGDLYCAKCNKEVHEQWDRDHTVVAFKKNN